MLQLPSVSHSLLRPEIDCATVRQYASRVREKLKDVNAIRMSSIQKNSEFRIQMLCLQENQTNHTHSRLTHTEEGSVTRERRVDNY